MSEAIPKPPGVEPDAVAVRSFGKLQLAGAVHIARNAQFLKATNLGPEFDRVAANVARPVVDNGVLLLGHVERTVAMIGAIVSRAKIGSFTDFAAAVADLDPPMRPLIPVRPCLSLPIQGSS